MSLADLKHIQAKNRMVQVAGPLVSLPEVRLGPAPGTQAYVSLSSATTYASYACPQRATDSVMSAAEQLFLSGRTQRPSEKPSEDPFKATTLDSPSPVRACGTAGMILDLSCSLPPLGERRRRCGDIRDRPRFVQDSIR
jgi:hypothetical protein